LRQPTAADLAEARTAALRAELAEFRLDQFRTWIVLAALTVFFSRQADVRCAQQTVEIDRSMPIVAETVPISKSAKLPFDFKSPNF
jgi:hypothetical protein